MWPQINGKEQEVGSISILCFHLNQSYHLLSFLGL